MENWSAPDLPPGRRPLYMIVMAHRRLMAGKPFRSPLVACYEVARAMALLGYQADLLSIDVSLANLERHGRTILEAEQHVVLNARSFGRIVDPALFLRPDVRRAVKPTTSTAPMVFQQPPILLDGARNAIGRYPHAMVYDFPTSRPLTTPADDVDDLLRAERNALLTASHALSLIVTAWHATPGKIKLNPLLQEHVSRA
ncbi:hypothetical protein [Actinoplanes subglobosus]|uniref:Uncharacterized protein n=1 Tax=Actinoplanes subglobosus TaxID=1547892 RepID=A0ABV8J5V2_9ACTN